MRWFHEHKSTIIIVVLVLFLLFCIGMTAQGRTNTTIAEGVLRASTSPVERVFYISSQYIKNLYTFILDLPTLKERNQKLEEEARINQSKLAEYDKLVAENQELSALLNFVNANSEREYITSSVISVDPYRGFSLFVIDKGSKDGIQKDRTVVIGEGLVGRVTEVSMSTSKVLSIIDTSSMFNGISVQSEDYVRITGGDNNKLNGYADSESNITVGEIIVTSGLTGPFPKDVIVGIVEDIQVQEGKLEKLITIKPSVDMEKINKVLIIK